MEWLDKQIENDPKIQRKSKNLQNCIYAGFVFGMIILIWGLEAITRVGLNGFMLDPNKVDYDLLFSLLTNIAFFICFTIVSSSASNNCAYEDWKKDKFKSKRAKLARNFTISILVLVGLYLIGWGIIIAISLLAIGIILFGAFLIVNIIIWTRFRFWFL